MSTSFDTIIDNHLLLYKEITTGNKKNIGESLNKNGISILKGFVENVSVVREFYKKVYNATNKHRIVLCGINPGRKGAGMTGVPFFDNIALSQILPSIKNNDSERSGQFIWSVISQLGISDFFENVYITNICWFGFTRYGRNYNYYNLEEELKKEFFEGFIEEMEIVQPSVIFSLSKKVSGDLKRLKDMYNKDWQIDNSLKHPVWCSFPTRADEWRKRYIDAINVSATGTQINSSLQRCNTMAG